jgi:mono/diheme cytochrome c family protein
MRTSVLRATALVLVCCSVQAFAGSQASPIQKPAGTVENGRRLFTKMTCHYCHGTEGQGSIGGVGPRIALVPRSLESFSRYVRRPTGRMTGYSETVLPDPDLADIYAFLRSLPAARSVAEIPLLEQLRRR